MRQRRLSLLGALFLLGALTFSGDINQRASAKNSTAPVSGLNLSFQPYTGKGYDDMPVEVLKFNVVVGYNNGGMWVHEWRLKNRSEKTVIKIRTTLFVYSNNDPNTLLLRHSTVPTDHDSVFGVRISPSQEWPRGKCSGYYCPNAFAMLSANELLKPLAKNGKLEGSYCIALGIDKVWFEDGTVWEMEAN